MPMLGFLGTVIGIAGTLGQIDSEMLASGSQEAMNRITAGLYVAFDKTAIALALTMVAMFMQFAVQRVEAGLLSQIDESVADRLLGFLADDEVVTFAEPTHDLIEKLTNKLASVVPMSFRNKRNCGVQPSMKRSNTGNNQRLGQKKPFKKP